MIFFCYFDPFGAKYPNRLKIMNFVKKKILCLALRAHSAWATLVRQRQPLSYVQCDNIQYKI